MNCALATNAHLARSRRDMFYLYFKPATESLHGLFREAFFSYQPSKLEMLPAGLDSFLNHYRYIA